MTVREATPIDRPAIRALQSLLPQPVPALFEDGLPPGVTLVAVPDEAGDDGVVAEEDGNSSVSDTRSVHADSTPRFPVGYVHAYDTGYVSELAVAPDHRDDGHGRALLSRCLLELATRGVERAELEVAADDDVARSLYETLGFAVVERISDRYDDADGLRMVIDLEGE